MYPALFVHISAKLTLRYQGVWKHNVAGISRYHNASSVTPAFVDLIIAVYKIALNASKWFYKHSG